MDTRLSNFILFKTEDEKIAVDVRFEDETVWLTQEQIATLFERDRTVIVKHIANIFTEGELEEKSNVHFLHIAKSDKPVKLYNLHVIISVAIEFVHYFIFSVNIVLSMLIKVPELAMVPVSVPNFGLVNYKPPQ